MSNRLLILKILFLSSSYFYFCNRYYIFLQFQGLKSSTMSHRHEPPAHHPPPGPPGVHYYYPPPPGYPPYPYPPGIYGSTQSQSSSQREDPRRTSHSKEPIPVPYHDMPSHRETYEEYMKKYYPHHPIESHYQYSNPYPPPPGHIPAHYLPTERPSAYIKPKSRSKSPRRRPERRPSPRKRSYSPPLKKRITPRARSFDRKRSETPPKYKKRPIMSKRPATPPSRKRSRTPPRTFKPNYTFSTTKKEEVYTKKAALERYHKEKEEKAKKEVYIRKEKSRSPLKEKPIPKVSKTGTSSKCYKWSSQRGP